jgi:hypothetical protein
MNRRQFVAMMTTAVGVSALDPERLLWRPGARRYFDIRQAWPLTGRLTRGDLVTFDGCYAVGTSGQSTERLQMFVVTEDVQGALTPRVLQPSMRGPGWRHQTVSEMPTPAHLLRIVDGPW